mgnify:CR=1 FL=1
MVPDEKVKVGSLERQSLALVSVAQDQDIGNLILLNSVQIKYDSLLKMEILQFVIWDPVSSKLQTNLSENYKLHRSLPEDGHKVSIINLTFIPLLR